MSQLTHTPGPWRATGIYDVRALRGGKDAFVASVFGAGEAEKSGNAFLIAAAPDLYKALLGLVEAIVDPAAGPIGASHLAAAKAALSKAGGPA